MAWTIEIQKSAKKELAKLDKTAADRILRFLEERIATDEDPRRFGEGLTENLAGLWKYRIGDFRVIAEIQEDRIVVPRKENFPDQRDFYGTLSHEMVHSTGIKERLDRDMSGMFGTESYAREELVAELGSAILSSMTGITTSIKEDNLQYLKNWTEAIGNDPGIITGAVSEAASAAELIDRTIGISMQLSKDLKMKEIIPDIEILSEKEPVKSRSRFDVLDYEPQKSKSRSL